MKKLSMNEMNLVSRVVIEKLNEKKYESIKGKLEKDVDFKKLEKLNKEKNELSKKINKISSEYSEIVLKVRNKYSIGSIYNVGNEVKVNFNDVNYNKVLNEIMLMNISREVDVESMINKIVDKMS